MTIHPDCTHTALLGNSLSQKCVHSLLQFEFTLEQNQNRIHSKIKCEVWGSSPILFIVPCNYTEYQQLLQQLLQNTKKNEENQQSRPEERKGVAVASY